MIKDINGNATITVGLHKDTKCINVKRRIRQGDTLSPKLFTAALDHTFKQLEIKGICIRRNALLSQTTGEIRTMITELEAVCQEVGLNMNFGRRKNECNNTSPQI